MPRNFSPQQRQTFEKLFQNAATLADVSEFLKNKNLTHSAPSWPEMWNSRIWPHLDDGKINVEELISLLQTAEEHQRQHIFWFQTDPEIAEKILSKRRLKGTLAQFELEGLLTKPLILNLPSSPTIVDVRLREDKGSSYESILIKEVERRQKKRQINHDRSGDIETITYRHENHRAINIIELTSDGFLQVRISSHVNPSEYEVDLRNFLDRMAFAIPSEKFELVDLAMVKQVLLLERKKHQSEIRYSNSELRTAAGGVIRVHSGDPEKDVYSDSSIDAGVDATSSSGNAGTFGESHNITFRERAKNGMPTAEVRVNLGGKSPNEFSTTRSCTQPNFEHVLDRIRRLNAPIPRA